VAFLSGRRFGYEVSGWVLAITALVGGVIGVVLAGFWEYQSLHRLGTTSVLVVGLAEETAKLVVPAALLLLLRNRHRHPANGLLIGVACGAGFAALETMGYAFVTLIQSHGSLAAVDGLLVVRGLLSPAGHMAWTGIAAAALWFAADRHWHPRASLRFVLAFLLAVGLHATWDGMRSTGGLVVVAAVSVVALVVTTVACSRGEWTRGRHGLAERSASTGVPAHPFVG
jgi:RsiW-degrading membrane proteinase PrsW (M82 family)